MSSQGAVVNRSKMYLATSPDNPIWGAMYFGGLNFPVEDPDRYVLACADVGGPPCVPNPFEQPECATDDPSTQTGMSYQSHWMYTLGPLPGGGADVGLINEMEVNLLAFGSIPATATLTMRTPIVDGRVQPLSIHIWQATEVGRATSCDPSFVAEPSALVEGQVNIYVSDLSIDGVPVELGPSCRTERPSDLYLWGDFASGAYTAGSGGPLGAYDGLHPGSILPLTSPVYQGAFEGRDIPASTGIEVAPFTGCGTGSDDLGPLLTAMASGPNNPVSAVQGPLVPLGEIPWDDFTRCISNLCPLPGPATPPRPPLPIGGTQ
ncbi:hypothetical protein [Aeromicrobium alkaliterrae]|uniref:hypothetical protein n=1 Tax=Aeromicrobium alkaliterrae TaxID=302168 RepID=UPI0031D4DD34